MIQTSLCRGFIFTFVATLSLNAQQEPNPAAVPTLRNDWLTSHENLVKQMKKQPPDVIFLGDSITAGWNSSPLFKEKYVPFKAVNAGVSGDRTQNVLWRVQNGLVASKPRLVILMIGVNNISNSNTTEQIASAIKAIVESIREQSPDTKILLLGILPAGEPPTWPSRPKVRAVNDEIAKLADEKRIFFLDIGPKLLTPEGFLTKEIAPDGLHLSKQGYQLWADAMDEKFMELLRM